jgi:OmcA/MtrC family decaheme c-type cytochrome
MWFHGNGRHGVETCLMCHSVAGAEDHPQYRTDTAPETPGVAVNFRVMLHKIHHGAELANASSYTVVGFGGSEHTYEHLEFPALPDGTKNCTKCHGTSDAWTEVAGRDHPTDQTLPAREWRAVCTTCHDDDVAAAHVEAQTAGGVETCSVCHGEGAEFGVEVMHKPR